MQYLVILLLGAYAINTWHSLSSSNQRAAIVLELTLSPFIRDVPVVFVIMALSAGDLDIMATPLNCVTLGVDEPGGYVLTMLDISYVPVKLLLDNSFLAFRRAFSGLFWFINR
jgi:hypothetical protein